jgi:hypothetical protein
MLSVGLRVGGVGVSLVRWYFHVTHRRKRPSAAVEPLIGCEGRVRLHEDGVSGGQSR